MRFDRNIFSFRPGESLADYVLNFDYAPGHGRKDGFEIARTVYRLRKIGLLSGHGGDTKR